MNAEKRRPGSARVALWNLHLKKETRDATAATGQAVHAVESAGAFGRFLRELPMIRNAMDKAIAKRMRAGVVRADTHTAQPIHRRFLRACLHPDISASAHPFNTSACGWRSLERHARRKLGTQPAAKGRRGADVGSHRWARPGGRR